MLSKKYLIAAGLMVVAIVGAVVIILFNKKPATISLQSVAVADAAVVLYYSDSCAHCQAVSDFIEQNQIAAKVAFQAKEVGADNQANVDELIAVAKICDIPSADIGVPFLWDGSQCLIGQDDIINFFKTKVGLN